MKPLLLILLLALTLPMFGGQSIANKRDKVGLSNPDDCKRVTFEGSRFTQCIADPAKHRVELRVTGSNGLLYRGFPALSSETNIKTVAFAMNGGMYDAGSKPIGYYVEKGEKLYALNMRDAGGNFYMKPNGIFFGTGDKWEVLTSDAFGEQVKTRPDFGTQSGPMLVIDGAIHPEFDPNGTSKHIRNAVGVDAQGRAHFVISDEKISFGRMARMMRDKAETPNALYLDGTVSALWNPATGRMDGEYPLGPLILVTRIANAQK